MGKKDYSYLNSSNIGISRGRSSIVEASNYNLESALAVSYGHMSIARCNANYSTAIAYGCYSISCAADRNSTAIAYNKSKAVTMSKKSIAVSYNSVAETDGKKSIAVSIGESAYRVKGSSISLERDSVAIGVDCYNVTCKGSHSIAIGNHVRKIKAEGKSSVAVSLNNNYDTLIEIGPNSVAVAMINANEGAGIRFIGGTNSRIMINILDSDNKIIKSEVLIIDGEKLQENKEYRYDYSRSKCYLLKEVFSDAIDI